MRTDTHPTSSNWEIRGKHVAVFFLLFFGTVFTVNFTMAGLANQSWTGLIAKNGYVASRDLAVAHRKRRLALAVGWTMDIALDDGTVVLDIEGINNAADDLTVSVVAERPLNEEEDMPLSMVRGGGMFGARSHRFRTAGGRWSRRMSSAVLELTERLVRRA